MRLYTPTVRCMLLSGLLVDLSIGTAAATPTLAPDATEPDEEILVKIRARQFDPSTVILHAGRKTRLIFHNQDVELHAFVPVGLFQGIHLNISGNGAPEFTEEGFKRVIIPSDGRAEFRFVPERSGSYPFFCDMPGHEMKANIVVQ
jgi:plastocyanin